MLARLNWIWTAASHAFQAWQLWIWLAPTGAVTAMTALFARGAELPNHLIVVYALGAFALASVGVAGFFHALLRQHEWRHRMATEGKLDYVQPQMGIDVHWDNKQKPQYFKKINVGIQLRNKSLQDIEYKILSYHALVEGRGPDTGDYIGRTGTVISHSIGYTHPKPIELSDLKKSEVTGTLDFKLEYGQRGKRGYIIERRQEFSLVLHPDSSVKPNPNVGMGVRNVD